jgi:hypothetical protein
MECCKCNWQIVWYTCEECWADFNEYDQSSSWLKIYTSELSSVICGNFHDTQLLDYVERNADMNLSEFINKCITIHHW